MIKESKFSFTQIYMPGAFLLALLTLVIYLLSHADNALHTKAGTTMDAGYVCALIVAFIVFFAYRLWGKLKKLIIDANAIIIRSPFETAVLEKENIKTIDLFARNSLGFLSNNTNVNGISITTKQGQTYFFADLFYRNASEVKDTIYNNFQPFVINPIYTKNHSLLIHFDSDFEKFSGNFILSANGIITVLVIGIMLWFLFFVTYNDASVFRLIFIYPCVLFYFGFGYQSHYFLLSDNCLVIKNQLWWWRNIEYDLSDIQQVIIERNYRQSNSLRVNTKDFKSRKFPAGSLYNKTWRKLADKLKQFGIDIQKEVIL